MTLVNPGLAHFAIDERASLFTVQAFAAGIVAVVAHRPKFAVRDMVGGMGFRRGVGLQAEVVTGEDTLRAQGSFMLMQSDYELRIASVAGGTVKLKDELRCAHFILGRRQDEELKN